MRRFLLVLAVLASLATSLHAQISLSGTIVTKDDEVPVPLAGIEFFRIDSVQIAATRADLNGNFSIPSLAPGKYLYRIEALGFSPKEGEIEVFFPSYGNAVQEHFVLEYESLDAAVATASRVKHQVDRSTYTLTAKDRANRTTGLEVVSSMPQLFYDEMNQSLKMVSGGKLLILINGISSSEYDLRALRPEQIKSIDYYHFPPSRFSGYSKVINVVTFYVQSGLSTGLSAQHAFTTGFANDAVYIKYNWKHNELSARWSKHYRNYHDIVSSDIYRYELADGKRSRSAATQKTFGYDDNQVLVSYLRQIKDRYVFQLTFRPNHLSSHSNTKSIVDYTAGSNVEMREQTGGKSNVTFSPSLDIYSEIDFSRERKLTLNFVGTYFNARGSTYMTQTKDLANIFQDNATQANRKKSAIMAVDYAKKKDSYELSAGGTFSHAHLHSAINNSLGISQYETKTVDVQFYGQLMGQYQRLSYLLKCAATYYAQNQIPIHYTAWSFQPAFLVGFKPWEHVLLRLAFERTKESPSLSQLSNNRIYLTEDIIQQGNPALINSAVNNGAIQCIYTSDWLDAASALAFAYEKDPIRTYFVKEGNHISQQHENGLFKMEYGAQLEARIRPFRGSNLFTAVFHANFVKVHTRSSFTGDCTYFSIPFLYTLNLNLKNFSLSYVGNLPGYSEDGAFLNSEEKQSTLTAKYKIKNWIFSANLIGLVTGLPYYTKTMGSSGLSYQYAEKILDNKNMFTLGVEYNFHIGKKYDKPTQRLNNSDNDSGIF